MKYFPTEELSPQWRDRIVQEGLETEGSFFWYPTNNFQFGATAVSANGGPAGNSGDFDGSPVGTGFTLATGSIDKGKIGLLVDYSIWVSSATLIQFDYGISKAGLRRVVDASGCDKTVNKILYPMDSLFAQIQGCVDPAVTKIAATMSYCLFKSSCDMDYDAPFRMEVSGDSNTVGSFQGEAEQLWHWIVRKWYRDNGTRIRVIDKSVGGKGSVHFEEYRKAQKFVYYEAPNIYLYALGTNDGGSASTYQANVTAMINWRLQKYPDCRIVIMGPIPKRGQETEMTAVRNAGAAAVAAIDDPRVIFINCGDIFDVNDSSFYVTPPNDGVHVTAAAHALWAQAVIDGIIANDEVSDTKFATFE